MGNEYSYSFGMYMAFISLFAFVKLMLSLAKIESQLKEENKGNKKITLKELVAKMTKSDIVTMLIALPLIIVISILIALFPYVNGT